MTDTTSVTELDRFLAEHVWDIETTRKHYAYLLPQHSITFENFDHLNRELKAHGNTFFGAQEMRIFRSKFDNLYNGRIFTYSNRHRYAGAKREYHVAWVYAYYYAYGDDNAHYSVQSLETTFTTLNASRRHAARLAAMVAGSEA